MLLIKDIFIAYSLGRSDVYMALDKMMFIIELSTIRVYI